MPVLVAPHASGAQPPLTLVAKALIGAWTGAHPQDAVPQAGLTYALAWSIAAEGAWSRYYVGTNNFGSMHATRSFAHNFRDARGYGMVAFRDSGPEGPYITRMMVFPSLYIGAAAYLDLVERDVDLDTVQTPSDFATAFYVSGYYEGNHTPQTPISGRRAALTAGTLTAGDQANIAVGAALVAKGAAAASAAIAGAVDEPRDPTAITVGPPFASLGERLTPAPSLAPHTLEHARELLGSHADTPPPGGISIADALSAPGGDGVWLFGDGQPVATGSSASSRSGGRWGWGALLAVLGLAAGVEGAREYERRHAR